jgi:hypothetical protein
MTIAIRASGNALSLHHHEEEHEMNEHQIVDSSFTAIINASIDKVDIPEWCFGLSEQEYQGCSPAHIAAGFTTAPDGKRMSINVEIIGGSMIVEHYIETLGTRFRGGNGHATPDRVYPVNVAGNDRFNATVPCGRMYPSRCNGLRSCGSGVCEGTITNLVLQFPGFVLFRSWDALDLEPVDQADT